MWRSRAPALSGASPHGERSETLARRARGGGPPLTELSPEARDRLNDELIDELLAGSRTEEEIVAPGGLLADLTRRLVERAMSAESTEQLGDERHREPPGGSGNTRNGRTPKTLVTAHGPVRIKTPRDRESRFQPRQLDTPALLQRESDDVIAEYCWGDVAGECGRGTPARRGPLSA